ncbi:single-pass membrane and coiled-coil domain-containing protein 4 [Tribolium madens]|uniref:single-pass membrane and coiled-coil domain-containing protein 4 n=1 Tax=Tribolium madens TaxID=41895 RepID=UPI001CF75587|nr:single-pass membrane and coiled-coil domain-containing protein 4 [Tribolium madens]
MRQLKGGKQKESSREKKQRKKEFAEVQKQVKTIVLPALAVSFILIVVYVYLKTRPSNYNMD